MAELRPVRHAKIQPDSRFGAAEWLLRALAARPGLLAEWDDYEWSWTGSLSRWALDHPGDPDAGEVMKAADGHRSGWLHGYRGTLGFACLLLRRTSSG